MICNVGLLWACRVYVYGVVGAMYVLCWIVWLCMIQYCIVLYRIVCWVTCGIGM